MTVPPPAGRGRTHSVDVRFHKWPDRLHWHFRMQWLAEDEHGVWLSAAAGTPARRGAEPPTTFAHDFVKLVPRDEWWTAIWNTDGKYRLYVDIVTPAVWDGDTVSMVDLDLDVLQHRRTGQLELVDEDEFLDHQVRYEYPPRLIDGARAAAARVMLAVERADEPFAGAGPRRLDEWAGLR